MIKNMKNDIFRQKYVFLLLILVINGIVCIWYIFIHDYLRLSIVIKNKDLYAKTKES